MEHEVGITCACKVIPYSQRSQQQTGRNYTCIFEDEGSLSHYYGMLGLNNSMPRRLNMNIIT
jgi:hypothetical protein